MRAAWFRRVSVVTALALASGASPVDAQVVLGEAVDRATGAPLRGVFVALLDDSGRQAAGALTGEDGRFRLRAPSPGRYTLRADRIGLATVYSTPLEVGPSATRYRFELESEAIQLEGLVVDAEAGRCRLRPGEGDRLQSLWEQVRIALEVAVWTERSGTVRGQQVTYERWLDPVSGRVRDEAVEARRTSGVAGFTARAPEDLVTRGFVRAEGDGYVFYGLDAGTIVSDAFLDTHCFRLRGPGREGRDGQVGLGFEPVPARTTPAGVAPGVRGVLWLDAATAELRSVEYGYTWMPWALPVEAFGGETRFRRLPNGAWVVERWSVRMPELERAPPDFTWSRLPARSVLERLRREAGLLIKEAGGQVTAVYVDGARVPGFEPPVLALTAAAAAVAEPAASDPAARDPAAGDPAAGDPAAGDPAAGDPAAAGPVMGRVVDADTGEPISGVAVRIEGVAGEQVTREDGRFAFPRVGPGSRRIEADHLAYHGLDETMQVEAGARPLRLDIRLAPSAIELDPLIASVMARPTVGVLGPVYDRIERVRELGGGVVFDREDIRRRNPNRFTHLLGEVAGVRVERVATAGRTFPLLVSTRSFSGFGMCPMSIYLDGAMLFRGGSGGDLGGLLSGVFADDINDFLFVSNLEAVEVYHPGDRMPAEFAGSDGGCGVVLVWTRRAP